MINRTTVSAGFLLLLTAASWAQVPATAPGISEAANEAIYRQANQIRLRTTLEQARGAEVRGDILSAGQLYSAAWDLVVKTGLPPQAPEAQQARAGMVATHSELARRAQNRANYPDADVEIKKVLAVDPQNMTALSFKQGNDKLMLAHMGTTPSKEVLVEVQKTTLERATNTSRVTDARLQFEMGKLDEAEATLKQALKEDPQNRAAFYYLQLIKDERYKRAAERREVDARQTMVQVEQDWATPVSKESLPQPNPYARSELIHTSKGRQAIVAKLDQIRLDSVKFDNVPLSAVVSDLNDEAKKRDPYKRGLNFIINPNAEAAISVTPAAPAINPATGLPEPVAAPAESVDVGGIAVKLMPPLTDVRLADVLNAIIRVADKPLKYTIEDYAIVFSAKGPEAIPLYTRVFKVDPNTFYQGLQSVGAYVFGETSASSGGGGGSGFGGISRPTSQNTQNQIQGSVVSRVSAAPGGVSGGRGGGTTGGATTGGGLKFITTTNNMEDVQNAAKNFFSVLGVTFAANDGKGLAWNDRAGELIVRATLQDLETIEAAIQTLNRLPPEVNIKAKFIEVTQTDNKALGFDWYLGNVLMANNSIVGSGGSQPSLNGAPSLANSGGAFPGNLAGGTTIAPSPTDQIITSGLRNSGPSLFSLTGILTDPQFRVVVKALDQRQGVDVLASPEVTIISGRQAQMKAVDVKQVITDFAFGQASGGGVTGGTGATVPSDRNIKTDFAAVDTQDILARVNALPITEWSYKAEGNTRHIGPMAQDFKAAFKLGADDKSIAVVDASGIALAAIKGLSEKNEKLESQIKQATVQLEEKNAEIKALKERLDKLEKLVLKLDK